MSARVDDIGHATSSHNNTFEQQKRNEDKSVSSWDLVTLDVVYHHVEEGEERSEQDRPAAQHDQQDQDAIFAQHCVLAQPTLVTAAVVHEH